MSLLPLPFTPTVPVPRARDAAAWAPVRMLHTALVVLGVFFYSGARLPLGVPSDSLGAVDPTSTLFQLILLFGSGLATLAHGRRVLALLIIAWPFLLLVIFLAASALWSDDPTASLRRSVSMLTLVCFTLSTCAAFGLRRFLQITLATLMAVAAAGILTALVAPSIGFGVDEYADAIRGLYPQKNSQGFAMLIASLCASYLVIARGRLRLGDAALLLAILAMTILARSTTSMLLCALTGGATVLFVWLDRGGAWAVGAMAGIGLGFVLGLATFSVIDTEVLFDLLGKDSSLTGRTFIWDATWRAIATRPLLGYGYSAFWNVNSPTVQLIWVAVGWETPNAHSGVLEILLQLGWLGGGLVLLMVAGTMGMAGVALVRGPRGAALWTLLVLVVMGIIGRTESVLLNPDIFMALWILALLVTRAGPGVRPAR